jgi:hypothetical protein
MSSHNQSGAAPDSFNELPIQPTGSGVADLEIAYEQMKLSEENVTAASPAGDESELHFTGASDGEAESEGHPS